MFAKCEASGIKCCDRHCMESPSGAVNWAAHAEEIELQMTHVEAELRVTVEDLMKARAELRRCKAVLDRRNKHFKKLLTTLKVTRHQLKSAKDDAKHWRARASDTMLAFAKAVDEVTTAASSGSASST